MPPKTLTAEQVAEIDRQQQKPVNWSAVVPQREDVLTYRVNRAAARQDSPAMLTAEQTDAAEAQNSVAAETSFGRAMGARPDRSVGPQVPAPKKVLSAAEVNQADYERVGNISYIPTKDEWKRYNELRQQRDDNVGKFIEAGQAIAGGLVQATAATAYAPFDFVARGTKAYDEWVNSSAEGLRQASISTAELWSWAGDVVSDRGAEIERNAALDAKLRQQLASENRFTGDADTDAGVFEQAKAAARASGFYDKTPDELSNDEDAQYQRFIRNRSLQQQAANITETNLGTMPDSRAEMGIDASKINEGLALGSAMVFDPLNVVVPAGLGAANKVRLLRRVGSLAGAPLKGASKVAGYAAGKAEGLYGKIVEGVESATGLTGSQQMSALSSVSFKAAAAMAALKKSGAVLRAAERGLNTGSILAREIGIGGVGASRVDAASRLRSAPIPERYRRAYTGFFSSADSTLRRVSETQGLSPIARRSAATLDKLGATQAFRLADDAVSGAVATAPIAVPLAAIAPEERRPEILGSIMTIGAGAGLIGGKFARSAEFEDALVAKMLADADISGGDATSMANMLPHEMLVNMARRQSVVSAKADFIPLRAKDYALNATVKEAMGLGTRGIYVDARKGQRPRIFVNLDKMASGDVAGHEIGHAIFKSDILGGEIKRGMRAMTDQQYGTDGVAARGREYVAAMLTQEVRDGATGIQLNVLTPDEVTRIAKARGDEAAERALTDEFIRERWANDADWRQQAIDERADMLNQESLGRGDTSWDWARDEIAAETFSGLGKGLNLSGIRASGPLSRAVGAASAGFEAMGARMRGNGRLETPNRLFVENPLFDTPEMRKAVNDYVKTFDRYLVGLEKEGAVKQRGTPIAPTGKAQDAARSPHTRTYSNRDGTVIESDLFIERPDGTRVPKSQQQLDTQEKVRAATIKSINDRTKFVNENSDEWGARKLSNGRVEVGGPTLPLQFDHFVQVPEWLRSKAREFEAGRSKGRSYLYSYNAIGTGEAGSYKIKNLGNVEAKTGEMVPFGWAVSTKNHLLAKVIDLNSFRAAAIRAIDNEQLGEFGNDLRVVESSLKQLLSNYENGVAGETGLGVTRKNILNGLLGTGTVVQKASNPVWHTLNNQGSVRTFRFDRLNYADPHGTGYFPHYNKININALPDDAGRMSLDQYGQFDADRKAAWMNKEAVKRGFTNATNWQNADAQGFQAADGQYRQQFPAGGAAQRGSAMPDMSLDDGRTLRYPKQSRDNDNAIQMLGADAHFRQVAESRGEVYGGRDEFITDPRNADVVRSYFESYRKANPWTGLAASEVLGQGDAPVRGVADQAASGGTTGQGVTRRGQALPDTSDAPPFYMKSTRVLDAKIQGKAATVDQVRAILTNPQNGIKAEELKWTGVLLAAERLAKENGGKVPKDALLKYLADDGAVRLEEVTMGGARKQWTQADINALERQAQRTRDFSEYERAVLEYEDQQLGSDANNTGNETRFGRYQLSGGENYREVNLVMPAIDEWEGFPEAHRYSGGPEDLKRIAHMRLNDRTDADGQRGLFIEEIQSDRHQEGRDQGYTEDFEASYQRVVAAEKAANVAEELGRPDVEEKRNEYEREWQRHNSAFGVEAVPDAPFRKDWPMQMFKRALRDAAGSGKDWIGWTTGETQAARYDLSKQVDSVNYDPFNKRLIAVKDGQRVLEQSDVPKEKLADYIGKDAASKLLEPSALNGAGNHVLSGDGLKVGGEGMKGFYDQILPKEISKYVKQWGAQVEKSGINISTPLDDLRFDVVGPDNRAITAFETMAEAKKAAQKAGQGYIVRENPPQKATPIWRVNITPEMRGSIRRTGQAMFLPDAEPVLQNFNAANEATGGSLRPVLEQPENASITGRITPAQEESIKELDEYYRKVTPQRIKELRNDAIDSLANRLINKGIPVAEARGLATETYKKIKGRVAGASQVISGMGTSDLSRMAGTGRPAVPTRKGVNPNWLTSAFEAFESDNDLAMMKAQQVAKQLNKKQQAEVSAGKSVAAARASKVRVSTVDLGMQFLIGEGAADKKAFGSSLREDPAAPPRVYASVVEGQKFGSQGNYAVFFEWKKSSPIVATSHHHYGVGNGLTDIHASANIGDKNARSFGNPEAETYDTLPSGRKVLNTRLLVGNAGLDDIRTHQLLVSIPESALSGVRAMYKKGGFGSVKSQLNDIAVRSLVGTKSQGKTKALTSKDGIPVMVAIQKNRTEAYVLNPDLRNVESITIVENKNKEKDTALIRKNLAAAFKNNGSPMPRIKVVSAESGPSGNRGRSKITDEFFNLTGKVVYGAMLGGLAASQTDDNR